VAIFGRFEFGKAKPSETYEGDSMTLKKGYIKIMRDHARRARANRLSNWSAYCCDSFGQRPEYEGNSDRLRRASMFVSRISFGEVQECHMCCERVLELCPHKASPAECPAIVLNVSSSLSQE
jgi:hypothetical protein